MQQTFQNISQCRRPKTFMKRTRAPTYQFKHVDPTLTDLHIAEEPQRLRDAGHRLHSAILHLYCTQVINAKQFCILNYHCHEAGVEGADRSKYSMRPGLFLERTNSTLTECCQNQDRKRKRPPKINYNTSQDTPDSLNCIRVHNRRGEEGPDYHGQSC